MSYHSDQWDVCPECGSDDIYASEDTDSADDTDLYQFCESCGHTDLEDIDDEY